MVYFKGGNIYNLKILIRVIQVMMEKDKFVKIVIIVIGWNK
jgi:hypothetical protein